MNSTVLWIISGVLALIPAIIWLYILFKDTKHRKRTLLLTFFGGIVAVSAVFALQYFWSFYPDLDPFLWVELNISDPTSFYIVLFILVGILEEIVKQLMLRYIDHRRVLIQTVNDSIKFSLVAALGFAFAENIFYFFTVLTTAPIQEFIVTFLFRSIFTACAHMIFSGIFGLYFGIAKFTIDISKHREWEGKVNFIVSAISKTFRIPLAHAYREYKILQGLVVAMGIHAIFNFLLQMNFILPTILLVIAGYALLRFLLKRKSGNLILVTDISEKRKSTMNKSDEDVVLELLGMWFKNKKFVDVMHVCERLLERDPDNNVVKLFYTKAAEKLDPNNPYRKMLGSIIGKKRSEQEINTLSYYREKREAEGRDVSLEQKNKMFRFVDERKKKRDETFKLKIKK